MHYINPSLTIFIMPLIFLIYGGFRAWLDYSQAKEIARFIKQIEQVDNHIERMFSELENVNQSIKAQKTIKRQSKEIK